MLDTKALAGAMAAVVREHVDKEVAPLRGRIEAQAAEIKALKALRPEKGDPGRDGADADMDALKAHLEALVEALPLPADGKDGRDGRDGEPGAPGEKGEPGKDGVDGKDGVGLAGAMIDRDGGLVVTLTNGEARSLGPVVGRDGRDGEPGPAGRDGEDGVGFDDLEVIHDGERTVTLRFVKGERVKEFPLRLPVVLDRGVFSEGKTYEAGDGVSWGGSFWIAQGETAEKPGEGKGWRLAVKRGQNGRDAK